MSRSHHITTHFALRRWSVCILVLWLVTQLPHQALAQVFQDRPSGGQLGQTIPDPQPVPLLAPTPEYTLPILTLDLYTTPPNVIWAAIWGEQQ